MEQIIEGAYQVKEGAMDERRSREQQSSAREGSLVQSQEDKWEEGVNGQAPV